MREHERGTAVLSEARTDKIERVLAVCRGMGMAVSLDETGRGRVSVSPSRSMVMEITGPETQCVSLEESLYVKEAKVKEAVRKLRRDGMETAIFHVTPRRIFWESVASAVEVNPEAAPLLNALFVSGYIPDDKFRARVKKILSEKCPDILQGKKFSGYDYTFASILEREYETMMREEKSVMREESSFEDVVRIIRINEEFAEIIRNPAKSSLSGISVCSLAGGIGIAFRHDSPMVYSPSRLMAAITKEESEEKSKIPAKTEKCMDNEKGSEAAAPCGGFCCCMSM